METALPLLLALGAVVGGALLGARLYGVARSVAGRLLRPARDDATIGKHARAAEDPVVVVEAVSRELLLSADMMRAMGREEAEIVEGVRNDMRVLGYEERYAVDGTPVWVWSASGSPPKRGAGTAALPAP